MKGFMDNYVIGQKEPIPPQGELNQIKPLTIEQLSRGYTVKVGCQTFAFSNKEELILKLIQYLNNPKETEQKWLKNELF